LRQAQARPPATDMIPIQELLSRIRWDSEFGRGKFIVGYYDRVDDKIIKVPLARIVFETESPSAFEAIEADGSVHSVPYHRVREVYRDGELIWRRPEPSIAHRR
jgi:uncharacterized protein (UPF0248 family)